MNRKKAALKGQRLTSRMTNRTKLALKGTAGFARHYNNVVIDSCIHLLSISGQVHHHT